MPSGAAGNLRVVLDTNLYVAAFKLSTGRNAVLLHAAAERRFDLLVSPPIIDEFADVLRTKFGWREDRIQITIKTITRLARNGLVVPSESVDAVTADPDDNRILECAAAGKADLIVTNDHHLLDLKEWSGISIIAAVDFRRMLGLK